MTTNIITDAQRALLKEIELDPIALARLKEKCHWESMSVFAVLEQWGDPRNWDQPARPPTE